MNGKEKIIITDDMIKLEIEGPKQSVMHNGEKDLMYELGQIASQNGGDMLELGFGLHLSADSIQSNPNVTSHTIIEIHPEIYQKALEWSKDKPNTHIILGDWFDVIPTLTKKFDGILHDTYNEMNFRECLDVFSRVCKKNAIVAFFKYPFYDHRFTSRWGVIDSEDLNKLPEKDCGRFVHNQFELMYTIFDGENFYTKRNTTHLL